MFGNPETTTGGRALKFYASIRLDIRRIQAIKEGDRVVGSRTRGKVVKNKVAAPVPRSRIRHPLRRRHFSRRRPDRPRRRQGPARKVRHLDQLQRRAHGPGPRKRPRLPQGKQRHPRKTRNCAPQKARDRYCPKTSPMPQPSPRLQRPRRRASPARKAASKGRRGRRLVLGRWQGPPNPLTCDPMPLQGRSTAAPLLDCGFNVHKAHQGTGTSQDVPIVADTSRSTRAHRGQSLPDNRSRYPENDCPPGQPFKTKHIFRTRPNRLLHTLIARPTIGSPARVCVSLRCTRRSPPLIGIESVVSRMARWMQKVVAAVPEPRVAVNQGQTTSKRLTLRDLLRVQTTLLKWSAIG